MIDSVGTLVRKAEDNYITGNVQISEHVDFSQYDTLSRIEAYLHSKHTSGSQDALGREKPFFNICIAAKNIWYRATNIARNKIRIKPTKLTHFVPAFLGTLHIQEWMKREGFEQFLDDWGQALAKYGSALTKWVEKDGKLVASVVPWNRIICDPISFEGNIVAEKLDLTPSQLKRSDYDQDQIKALIDTRNARTTLGGQKKDNKSDYITIYEVHGELPLSYLTDNEEDEEIFVQQMHVISFVENTKDKRKDDEEFTLYRGREKNPYLLTHLLKEDGRTLGIGSVEHLFDAQWMTNLSMKQMKDQLDLASQLIFQTADKNFLGKNFLTSVVTGDVQIYEDGKPLSPIANNSHDITALQNFSAQWQVLAKDITSTPDAIRGNTMPSGTAFRQVAVLNQESHSLFEVMIRNKKRYLDEMIRKFVIPHVKKKMDTSEEISATLESQDITKLDSIYVPQEAIRRDNEQIKKTILSGGIAQNLDRGMVEQEIQKELSTFGNQRFIKPSDIKSKTWKEVLKDLEWEVEIDIEDKKTDDQLILQYLIDWFKTIANPAVQQFLTTPQGKLMANKIMERSNFLSPLEVAQLSPAQPNLMQESSLATNPLTK